MLYENVELFNIEETEKYNGGVILKRYPDSAKQDMKDRAAWIADAAMGNEIRLVCEGQGFYLTIGAGSQDVKMYAMRGDYAEHCYHIKAGKKICLRFDNNNLFANICDDEIEKFDTRFSHNVWRFYFHSEGFAVFYDCRGFGGSIRPPKPCELPKKTMLAYGSSITHWCYAIDSRNSYIQQAARRLDMDVLNKGMAGACRLEYSIMEYFISLDAWDIAFFELGANVLDLYSVEEFRERAEYLIKNICFKKPDNPVFITGLFYGTMFLSRDKEQSEKTIQFENVLKEIKDKYELQNLIYVDGRNEIMDNASYLSFDLVHPSDYGHIRMGENLACVIAKHSSEALRIWT